ncbi:cyclic pyranopterin monophosphate synthase MoaC [Neomegalonema perideroedes]|uniref:cyclic pyranopterin monophosphate synthase MoaC n=1 Tax=Neomegalonema perideroedes TaxID=217219 RepID=UPI00036848A5|nr:cyclic pyranopterin monophosphate synthase MoaC [Neomegalonema perideroedes]
MSELTHFDQGGAARMVDVSAKPETSRLAVARGAVEASPETIRLIESGGAAKGDVLGVARLAGIMAAKKTADLIPLCHPLPLSEASVSFTLDAARGRVEIEARVKTAGRTGVEMEALTAVSVAALTIYDMVKAADKGMRITEIRLIAKEGGRSGSWRRPDEPESASPV